jgi:hypothetical protein
MVAESNGNGRDERGRFQKGCKPGPGNPHLRQVSQLRTALMRAVTPSDIEEVVAKLLAAAKTGDTVAAREILNRVLGTPSPTDVLTRLEALEEAIHERNESR